MKLRYLICLLTVVGAGATVGLGTVCIHKFYVGFVDTGFKTVHISVEDRFISFSYAQDRYLGYYTLTLTRLDGIQWNYPAVWSFRLDPVYVNVCWHN